MANKNFNLVVKQGDSVGKTYALTGSVIIVGRDPVCDIVLNDNEVSRQHAQLIEVDAGYQIQDIGSTNGTFVDGIRLSGPPVVLKADQEIALSSTVRFTYEIDAPANELLTMEADRAGTETVVELLDDLDSNVEFPSESVDEDKQPEEPDKRNNGAFDPDEEFGRLERLEYKEQSGVQNQPQVVVQDQQDGDSNDSRRWFLILGVLVAVLLFMCCGLTVFMYQWGGDWLLRQLGYLQ